MQPPLSSVNYLYELDRLTQTIISEILVARKVSIAGPIKLNNCSIPVNLPENINAIQLNRLRRQFLHYNKLHYTNQHSNITTESFAQLFVQFLNSNVIEQ